MHRAGRRVGFAGQVRRLAGLGDGIVWTDPALASAQIFFFLAELGHQHGATARWLPGGTLIPVTGPLAP